MNGAIVFMNNDGIMSRIKINPVDIGLQTSLCSFKKQRQKGPIRHGTDAKEMKYYLFDGTRAFKVVTQNVMRGT
jgi:hypothetical protein